MSTTFKLEYNGKNYTIDSNGTFEEFLKEVKKKIKLENVEDNKISIKIYDDGELYDLSDNNMYENYIQDSLNEIKGIIEYKESKPAPVLQSKEKKEFMRMLAQQNESIKQNISGYIQQNIQNVLLISFKEELERIIKKEISSLKEDTKRSNETVISELTSFKEDTKRSNETVINQLKSFKEEQERTNENLKKEMNSIKEELECTNETVKKEINPFKEDTKRRNETVINQINSFKEELERTNENSKKGFSDPKILQKQYRNIQ